MNEHKQQTTVVVNNGGGCAAPFLGILGGIIAAVFLVFGISIALIGSCTAVAVEGINSGMESVNQEIEAEKKKLEAEIEKLEEIDNQPIFAEEVSPDDY